MMVRWRLHDGAGARTQVRSLCFSVTTQPAPAWLRQTEHQGRQRCLEVGPAGPNSVSLHSPLSTWVVLNGSSRRSKVSRLLLTHTPVVWSPLLAAVRRRELLAGVSAPASVVHKDAITL